MGGSSRDLQVFEKKATKRAVATVGADIAGEEPPFDFLLEYFQRDHNCRRKQRSEKSFDGIERFGKEYGRQSFDRVGGGVDVPSDFGAEFNYRYFGI